MIIRVSLQLEVDTRTHQATVIQGTVEKNPKADTVYCPGPCGGVKVRRGYKHCSLACKNIMRQKKIQAERLRVLRGLGQLQEQLESERSLHETTIQEGL